MASDTSKLQLRVVSQEKELLSESVDSITLPTASGEITVLPGHIPLFSQIKLGMMTIRKGAEEQLLVVSDGFLDVTPHNEVVVMVDSGALDRDISLQAAQKAVEAAEETMTKTVDQRELLMAEASLRRALLEVQIASRSKKSRI
jgi:F-type H+-transporting ATPase subunit epsilon